MKIFTLFIVILEGVLACSGQQSPQSDSTSPPNSETNSRTMDPGNSGNDVVVEKDSGSTGSFKITLRYKKGSNISPPIVYAVWLEDKSGTYLYPLYVCKRLLDNSLTGTALPYWSMNKRPRTDQALIDAVTGATVQVEDFQIDAAVEEAPAANLTIYVEMDHSFDQNDWFSDQPAVLWAAEIDMKILPFTAVLKPVGWTPESSVQSIPDAKGGVLNSEIRYITNHKAADGFGAEDERSALNMVNTLTVSVTH